VNTYTTLMTMLAESPSMVGVSLAFGEENINAQEYDLPLVVVVPIGGPLQQSGADGGYYRAASNDQDNLWNTREAVALVLWAASTDSLATPAMHADECETLRQKTLQALQCQAPNGLMFRPVSGQWMRSNDVTVRFGRAYTLTCSVDISIPGLHPVEADVDVVEINAALVA
jgi:hypothetical protein